MTTPEFGKPLPIEIIVVVEGGCCREVYSLDIPLKYTILDFDNECEDEEDRIREIWQQDAVVKHNTTLAAAITKLMEEYS